MKLYIIHVVIDLGNRKIKIPKTLQQVEAQSQLQIQCGTEKSYSEILAYILSIRYETTMFYLACTSCSKKVTQDGEMFRCDFCSTQVERPTAKYVLSLCVADSTGQIWTAAYNDIGNQILGHSADEIKQVKDSQNEKLMADIIKKAIMKEYKMLIFSTLSTYQGQQRIKHQILKLTPINYKAESYELFKSIQEFVL